jgi:protein SCO1/2
VYFGYTNCPDACPVTLSILDHVQESLRAQGLPEPHILFVSLDPERDTPDVLRRYTSVFGSQIAGATGDELQLRGLVHFFGVSYERKETGDKGNYTLDHTTNFFLVTPEVRWLASFAPADDADAVTEDTLTLLRLNPPH